MSVLKRRGLRLPMKATALALSGLLSAGSVANAAGCLELYLTGFKEFQQAKDRARPRLEFHTEEMFVLCVTLGQEAYVSIDDAPPKGDKFERLFPNRFSHPNPPMPLAAHLDAGKVCFGTPDNFPLFHPKQDGTGPGKISILATARMEDQVAPYVPPGQSSAGKSADSRSFRLEASCQPVMKELIDYRVTP